MPSQRIIRVNELIKREISTLLFSTVTSSEFDHASVTVTSVNTSPDLRNTTVMVSVYGDAEKGSAMINILKRYRKEIQQKLSKTVILKYTPRITFKLDTSLEAGDKVLGILGNLAYDEKAAPFEEEE